MTTEEQLAQALDELGDWHATFPGKKAEDVIRLWAEADKQLNEARRHMEACRVLAKVPDDEALYAWLEILLAKLDQYRSELLRLRDVVGEVDAALIDEALKEL